MKKENALEKITALREENENSFADIKLYKHGKKNEIGLIASLMKRLLAQRKTINELEHLLVEQDIWTE